MCKRMMLHTTVIHLWPVYKVQALPGGGEAAALLISINADLGLCG